MVAGPPARLHVVIPGTARPGQPVPVRIAALDPSGNAGVDFEGDVELGARIHVRHGNEQIASTDGQTFPEASRRFAGWIESLESTTDV